ncbi:MAG: hypothetical protein AAF570_01905 [Bacteroidota bacterium]
MKFIQSPLPYLSLLALVMTVAVLTGSHMLHLRDQPIRYIVDAAPVVSPSPEIDESRTQIALQLPENAHSAEASTP